MLSPGVPGGTMAHARPRASTGTHRAMRETSWLFSEKNWVGSNASTTQGWNAAEMGAAVDYLQAADAATESGASAR